MARRNNKNTKKNKKEVDNKFSFDNEIIIGVTRKDDDKKEQNVKKKNKATKKTKKQEKKIKNNVQTKNKPKKKKIEKKKQKKYREELSAEELEKRNAKKVMVKRILKCIMVLLLFFILAIVTMFSPIFNIKEIKVEGNDKISENEIISLSQIELEQNIFKISKKKIANQIKENAYIGEVKIKRNLPTTLVLQVEERKAAYLLEYAGGYIYIDRQGYMLETSTEKLELPVLQGATTETSDFVVGNRLNKDDLKRLSAVLKIMDMAEANQISNLITRIDIQDLDNLKIAFETKDKVAHLGNTTKLLEKMRMIKIILERNEGKPGDIFVNMDLNKSDPVFRERV